MRSLTRPIVLLFAALYLGLIFTNAALAFECTNAGAGSTAPDDGGFATRTACGDGAVASGAVGTAVGGGATAGGAASTALGREASASGTNGTALGRSAKASGVNGTALGQGPEASGSFTTALGSLAKADADNTTAVGYGATSSGAESTALGRSARVLAPHINATALGWRAQPEQSNAMVLGSIPGVNDPLGGSNEYVDVGIGTSKPHAPLHIRRKDGTQEFLFLESDAPGGAQDRAMMQLINNGGIRFQFYNPAMGTTWRFQAATGNQDNFEITKFGTGQLELVLQNDGDLIIAGSLTQNSDVNAKQDIEATDGHLILAKLDSLPVSEWTYKRDTSGARHLGPMAQDFHAAFGLGEDETKIAPGDMAGVNMAAIKALKAQHEKAMAEKNAELAELRNRLARLETLMLKNSLNMSTAGL